MPKLEVSRKTREELKEIVLGICSGEILTFEQVPSEMRHMVFLPMGMGALSPPSELMPLIPDPPKPQEYPPTPNAPTMPPAPTALDESTKPVEPPYPTEDMDAVRWGRKREEDVLGPYNERMAIYQTQLAQWEQEVKQTHAVALEDHARQCAALETQHQDSLKAHARMCAQIKKSNEEQMAAYEAAKAAIKPMADAIVNEWASDLGTIYGRMEHALPRGINGYPMFMRITILHKDDWDIVRPAVNRELERRKNDDLLGGL